MVAAISIAATACSAISSADALLGKTGTSSTPPGGVWRNLPFYIMSAVSVAGAVAAIASAILGQFVITGCAAALSLTNGFSAYQLRNLGLLKSLEGYVKSLADRVNSLGGVVKGLREERVRLQSAAKELEQSAQRYKQTMNTQKAALENALKRSQEIADSYEKEQKEWEATTQKHIASITSLEKEQKIRDEQIKQLTAERNALANTVRKLENVQGQLTIDLGGISSAGSDLGKQTEALKQNNAAATSLAATLQSQASLGNEQASQVAASANSLEKTASHLNQTTAVLGSRLQSADQTISRLEAILKQRLPSSSLITK